jgi:O-antigen/teichoic acid export membrane protein
MTRWIRIRELSRLISEYTLAQALIQLLSVAAGLLIINFLPVREFALYALALSVVTFLAVFSDLGLSGALLYFRREARKQGRPFEPYVAASLRMRRALMLAGAGVAVGFMLVVGSQQGFGAAQLAGVIVLMIATVWVQISVSIGLVALRLEGLYRQSYVAECAGNAVRLLGIGVMIGLSALQGWVAMLSGLAGTAVTHLVVKRGNPEKGAARSEQGAALPYRELLRYVLPASPSAAYFAVQGPLVIWLSAFFSGTETIAEVGALGRLGALMGLVTGFMGTVLFPRLAAVTDDRLYLRRYLQVWAILIALGSGVIAVALAVPDWFLLLLGSSYAGLEREFAIVAVSSVLATWGGYVSNVSSARGWVRPQPLLVAVYAGVQVALIVSQDLSTTAGVLWFGLLSGVAGLVIYLPVNIIGFVRPAWVAAASGSTAR